MELHIEIHKKHVKERVVESRQGKSYTFREQEAWLKTPSEPYPQRMVLQLADRPPYEAGQYRLLPASFRINRFEQLELRRIISIELIDEPEPPASNPEPQNLNAVN